MKKNILVILLLIICMVLSALLLSARNELSNLKQERSKKTEVTDAIPETTKTPAPDQTETDEIISFSSTVPEEADATSPDIDSDLVQTTLKNQQRVMSSMANMRENPTINKMIEASQRGTIGALYSDMIGYLELTPDETKYFMDLLMFRQMENVDFGMKLMSGQLTEEQRKEQADHLADVGKQMKEEMKAFLNDGDDYEEFEFYEKTISERMALSQMDQTLSDIEQPLSDVEYRDLLDMMQQEKTQYDWSTDLHNQDKNDISPERFSAENTKKHIDDVQKLNDSIFEKAAGILTAEQLEAFKSSVQATTDMQMAQLEMAAQLLRNQK